LPYPVKYSEFHYKFKVIIR